MAPPPWVPRRREARDDGDGDGDDDDHDDHEGGGGELLQVDEAPHTAAAARGSGGGGGGGGGGGRARSASPAAARAASLAGLAGATSSSGAPPPQGWHGPDPGAGAGAGGGSDEGLMNEAQLLMELPAAFARSRSLAGAEITITGKLRRPPVDGGAGAGLGLGHLASTSWAASLAQVVLPKAYFVPGALAPEYVTFQAYDTLQGLCSYLRMVVCQRGLLKAYGVGDAGASATAATLTWVMRDGIGMLSGLWLAWVGSSSFGKRLKAWRLFADVANDAALVLDLFAPRLVPGMELQFKLAICASSVLKAFCGVAAGATRAAITQHMARSVDDVADVQAKEGSQETFVTLLGMLLGSWLVYQESVEAMTALFWLLTLVHVLANWKAVTCLSMRTLDLQRLVLALRFARKSQCPTFEEVAALERLVYAPKGNAQRLRFLGPDHVSAADLVLVHPLAPAVGVVVSAAPAAPGELGGTSACVRGLVVGDDASALDVLTLSAWLVASASLDVAVETALAAGPEAGREWAKRGARSGPPLAQRAQLVAGVRRSLETEIVAFRTYVEELASAGWDLEGSRSLLGDERERRVEGGLVVVE